MDKIRKKYVRTVDISRLLMVFSISFLIGVILSTAGISWTICFCVIMLASVVLGQISQKILLNKLGDKYLVSKTVGFLIFSIALNVLLIGYLIINRQYIMLLVATVTYIILLAFRRGGH